MFVVHDVLQFSFYFVHSQIRIQPVIVVIMKSDRSGSAMIMKMPLLKMTSIPIDKFEWIDLVLIKTCDFILF